MDDPHPTVLVATVTRYLMQYLAAKELHKESGYRGKMISYSKERGDDYVTVYRIKGYLVVYAIASENVPRGR